MQTQFIESVPTLKVVGTNGQISLGKEFAGKQVQVEMREPGVWVVRTVVIVPTNELWLHEPSTSAAMARAVEWAQANPARQSDLSVLIGAVENGESDRKKTDSPARSGKPSRARQG